MTALETRTALRTIPIDDAPPPGQARGGDGLRTSLSQVLVLSSLLLAWAFVHLVWLSALQQAHAQDDLYAQVRSQLAEGTVPVGAPIAVGAPVAVLDIPAIGLEGVVVVEGARPAQLQRGPGHVGGSVLPGQQGASLVAGRALTHGAPFARIDRLRPGTVIEVTTGQGQFVYGVTGVRSEGDPAPTALEDGASRLTLVTASRGDGLLGGLRAGEAVHVDATLMKGAVAPGPTTATDPDPRLMSSGVDTATLAELALCLQLLAASLAAFTWSWTRWSRTATWMACTPCVLASLWLTSTIGSRLLPGLV